MRSTRATPTPGVAVCIVNEAFANTYLRGRSPIGAQVAIRPANSPQAKPQIREIVGVARQVKRRPDELEDLFQVYVPLAQDPTDDIYLAVQTSTGSAEALTPSVRAAIGRIDKEQLVSVRDVMTLDDIAWNATSRQRFRASMVIAFAGLALLLAMVGVFGILAYSVQLRVRDFGVRRALGASTTGGSASGDRQRRVGDCRGHRDRPDPRRDAEPAAGQHAVRRPAAGSGDFRVRAIGPCLDRGCWR